MTAPPSAGADWWASVLGPSPILDGKYRLEARLGGGAMGEVFGALHLGLRKRFAVKLLHPRHLDDPGFFQRFQREAEALGTLEHPHIVRVTDFGIEPRGGGIPYLVMEELPGRTLAEHVTAIAPTEEALTLLTQIAGALDHAHRRGVLHCDLKAANVLVVAGEQGPSARLVDFGLARLAPQGPPASGSEEGAESGSPLSRGARSPESGPWRGAIGTPLYLAPELTRGAEPSPASDLYAFGVLAYRLLTGRHPFEGPSSSLPAQHLTAALPRPSEANPELPEELDRPLLDLLARDPSRRPASAGGAMSGLAAAWALARLRAWKRRERPLRLVLAAALSLVLLPAAWAAANLPLLTHLESRATDALFWVSPLRAPDSRLLLVVLDEATLEVDSRPLEARADETGLLLTGVLEAGGASLALDLLLPASWAHSRPFAELLLRHGQRVGLAMAQTPEGELVGPEAVSPLVKAALGPEAATDLFAFAFLDEDPDGRVRRFRPFYATDAEAGRPVLATRLVASGGGLATELQGATTPRLIDFRSDWRRLERLSWRDLEAALEGDPGRFSGRLVLVGATFTGSGDLHRVPGARSLSGRIPGVVLQALAADTLLAGARLRPVPSTGAGLLGLLALLGLMGASSLLLPLRSATGWRFLALSSAVYAGIALIAFVGVGWVLPLVVPLLALLLGALSAALTRRWRPPAPAVGKR